MTKNNQNFSRKSKSRNDELHSDKQFDIVGLVYPNESRNNIAKLYPKSRKPEPFNWFICSYRVYDDDNKMYYSSVSQTTGETLTSRGLSNTGKRFPNYDNSRAKLLILSDPHNKKMLCKQFGYMCGCNSIRDVLSTRCHLTTNSNQSLIKGAKYALKLGYDGVVIQHDCVESELDTSDAIICQNATFVFKKNILKNIDPSYNDKCGIVKYSKKHNSCIRKVIPSFPTILEINDLLEDNNCSVVNMLMYDIVNLYITMRVDLLENIKNHDKTKTRTKKKKTETSK
jgi:hypothetical protein